MASILFIPDNDDQEQTHKTSEIISTLYVLQESYILPVCFKLLLAWTWCEGQQIQTSRYIFSD